MAAVQHLIDLQTEGLIQTIGLCNFDTLRTDQICTQFGPGAIVSNQVQVSLHQLFRTINFIVCSSGVFVFSFL